MDGERKHCFENVGYHDCADLHAWGPGIRSVHIIHYILKGKGTFLCGKEEYHLTAGQSFYIAPGQTVRYFPDPADPWVYTWVDFSAAAAELLTDTDFARGIPVTPVLGSEIGIAFENIRKRGYPVLYYEGCLRTLLGLYAFFANGGSAAEERVIERAKKYIALHLHQPTLTVEGCARYVGLNRTGLFRLFRQEEGTSPKDYILRCRMARAEEILLTTDVPVKTVAFSVGFSDPLYFSKVFRQRKGISPGRMREEANAFSRR